MKSALSPALQEFLDLASMGLEIGKMPEGTYFSVETESGSVYTIVISDPEKAEFALQETKRFSSPTLCVLQGSSAGGSSVAIGRIGIGLRMKFNPLSGGLLITTPVIAIRKLRGKKKAAMLLKTARENAPKGQPISREAFLAKIKELVIKEIPPEYQERVQSFIDLFPEPMAAGAVLGIFSVAQEAGKLEAAFPVMEKMWEDEWSFMHPALRGVCEVHEKNAFIYDSIYSELGLPNPAHAQS